MVHYLIAVFIFVQYFQLTFSAKTSFGFDVDGLSLSASSFNCLKNNGSSFFISRIYKSIGQIDSVGIKNIVTAKSAGFTDVDAYLFPCTATACPSAADQIQSVFNALLTQNLTIGRLWIDVQELSWSSTKATNQQFILDMVNAAKKLKFKIGIYTGYSAWEAIVGNSWTSVSQYPLWWQDYACSDLTCWKDFGGWTSPTIHQFSNNYACFIDHNMNIKYK